MKTMFLRLFALILCLAMPCAALAESTAPSGDVLHAEFTLGLGIHADGFPPGELHLRDWEKFLNQLSIVGSLDGMGLMQPDSRIYADAGLYLNGEETIPFIFDCDGANRFMISPIFRDDPVLFYMNSYFEFMMKFYYYLGLPANYVALLTYPSAAWYIADSFYTPLSEGIAEARDAALSRFGDEKPENLTYKITYDRMLRLCQTLNAVTTEDTHKRVQWFFNSLLADLYLSDVVVEALSSLDLAYQALDPGKDGLVIAETGESMICTVGGQEVFTKTITENVTETAFTLPLPDGYMVSFLYRGETAAGATAVSAAFSVTKDEDALVKLTAEGTGLPAEGSLAGNGQLSFVLGGSEIGETLAPQTLQFSWLRSARELPCDLDITLSWLHPDTGLPAAFMDLSAALSAGDESVFVETDYPTEHFFGINPMQLMDYKQRWTNSAAAYLLPVVLRMPLGVIDDTVAFLLDSGILLSVTE